MTRSVGAPGGGETGLALASAPCPTGGACACSGFAVSAGAGSVAAVGVGVAVGAGCGDSTGLGLAPLQLPRFTAKPRTAAMLVARIVAPLVAAAGQASREP